MVVLPDPGSPVRTIKPCRVSTPKTSCNNASSCPEVEWKLCEFGDSAKGFCRSPKCPRTSWYICTIQQSFILRGRRRKVFLGQGLAARNERRFTFVIPEVSTPACTALSRNGSSTRTPAARPPGVDLEVCHILRLPRRPEGKN